MEENILISKTPSPNSSLREQFYNDLQKQTLDTCTKSDWNNRRSSFQPSEHIPDIGRQSLPIFDINSGDFGRVSLGILPPDFEKDCLGFLNTSNSEIWRESLGILEISALRDSLSFRRESLGILNLTDLGRESLECGRESLGILHLKSPDVKFGDEDTKIPDIILTTIEENSEFTCDPLDIAFLQSYSRKSSTALSISSSVTPSFNSGSFEGPSNIYSPSFKKPEDTNQSDLLNKAFINPRNISIYSVCCPNRSQIFHSELFGVKERIRSLPVTLEENVSPLKDIADFKLIEGKFWSTNRAMKTRSLDCSFHGTLDFGEESNEFQDSVFIEGHHIAEKLADGSILNDSCGSDIGILDCTPQPTWPDESSYEKEKEVKNDTKTIFKTVDKMLPPPAQDNVTFKIKTSKTDTNVSNNNKTNISSNSKLSQDSDKDDSRLIQNISNITRDFDKHSISRKSNSVSEGPKEILHKLSEILNLSHYSDQQKSEGQNLISSLAGLLHENNSNSKLSSPNDSGHSSTNDQSPKESSKLGHQCFEVSDPPTNSTSKDISNELKNKCATLDLSSKSRTKGNASDQHLSPSFSSRKSIPLSAIKKNMSVSCLDINKNKSSSINNSSANSNDSKSVNNVSKVSIAGKLRQKSVGHNTKKGPMKAVIPVGDMKKRHSLAVTPERSEQKPPLYMQSKRTSTPINEPKLRPMAASTPTERRVKDKNDIVTTPLSKLKKLEPSPNLRRSKGDASTSLPRPLNMESKLFRRNSVSEIKKTEAVGRTKRSNSIESETRIMSSLAKVRQNIINSPHYQLRKQNVLMESNLAEMENKVKPERKIGSLGKTKHLGNVEKFAPTGCTFDDELVITKSFSKQKKTVSSNVQRDQNGNLIPSELQSNINQPVVKRRHSLCDIKKLQEKPSNVKRSNSFKIEAGVMSSFHKIRQNIINSPFYKSERSLKREKDK